MKTLKITLPEGYEIDTEKSTFEQIVFKPLKVKYPTRLEEIDRPWEFASLNGALSGVAATSRKDFALAFHNAYTANAVVALIQLLAFRDAVWEIDGWKPDWNESSVKYCICFRSLSLETMLTTNTSMVLSFKTQETAEWFLQTHRELIEQAKALL